MSYWIFEYLTSIFLSSACCLHMDAVCNATQMFLVCTLHYMNYPRIQKLKIRSAPSKNICLYTSMVTESKILKSYHFENSGHTFWTESSLWNHCVPLYWVYSLKSSMKSLVYFDFICTVRYSTNIQETIKLRMFVINLIIYNTWIFRQY